MAHSALVHAACYVLGTDQSDQKPPKDSPDLFEIKCGSSRSVSTA